MNESAVYEISLKDRFSGPLSGLERQMDGFERKVGGLGSTIAGVFGGSLLAGGFSSMLSGVKDLAFGIVKLGADMEQTRISFTTMLGSAEKANQTLAKLVDFAEITPFGQAEVITGAKQLLAYGFAAEDLTTDLRRLGDVSSGLSIPLGDLVYLYGTIRTQGKAMTKDLMQFANRGIPIYSELSKVTGKSKQALQDMVEKGEIGFDVIEKAFISMTKSGSMFGGLMEKQSRSLIGRWSTLKDKILVMGTALGEGLIPSLGKTLEWTISMVELIPKLDFSPLVSVFKDLGAQVDILFDQFGQLMGIVGEAPSKFNLLTYALRYLSFGFRVAWSPIRAGILIYSEFIALVKNSVDVFKGLGTVLAGVFTRNISLINMGVAQMGKGFEKMTKDAVAIGSGFLHNEKKGWGEIFSPIKEPGKDSAYADGKGAGAGSGGAGAGGAGDKSKSAGVEKISAGTRNVTLNIGKLIGEIKYEKWQGNPQDMTEAVRKAVLAAVNDVNIVAD